MIELSKPRVCVICLRLRQITQTQGFDNSWYHAQPHPIIIIVYYRLTLNDNRTVLSCKWLTVDKTFYFHSTVQNGNAWFGRGGMWECKPFDEAGDTLHTRSVISPGKRKKVIFVMWFHCMVFSRPISIYKIQSKTRLHKLCSYSPEPRIEVFCFRLSFNISKLVYCWDSWSRGHLSRTKGFKVHLTPKYFFCSNKSLHLCETHCAFLPLFKLNLDFS